MIKDVLLQLKYMLSHFTFNRKKDTENRLKESFGEMKTERSNFKMIETYFRNKDNLYHFSEVISNNTVGFDYKLKNGKLKNRNAIRILEINQYPTEVVQEAMSISEVLDLRNSKV